MTATRRIETVPRVPPADSSLSVDEGIIYQPLYKKHHIKDEKLREDVYTLAEQGNPEDIVRVTLVKDFEHFVGNDYYKYEAFKETTVPRHVAEFLAELGLLYIGGVASSLIEKVYSRKNPSSWSVNVSDYANQQR